ncbi:TPA: AAA family ATPase [Pseudomonas aeruginosa]|uniref:AAA family ATPase n=1 Tax=Pseudomonas aeruginosa TaxID=287 RepID=UPI001EEEFAC0|nr:ATP-binding protein [Pseudomonas aeruginosa]EKU0595913.1 AAA family ATPase [Pseudomonas aeruginosa]MCG0436137.1 AAA family ATPase [Pseudomonas aeruginosa]HBN7618116.1 AAA family ATPase [Pseudomonas aeruginosa]HBN7622921.1 AAA family ATPase [Pseudomonas aeruginosa]HBN7658995.1 AAA family ATPase [Pseudomonas aeruginosa]
MQVTRVKLKNWRNFRSFDAPMRDVTYILGPNASGKSNLLDVFRFLRDVSKPAGGGLQAAVIDRGGISKLRCLHARRDPEVCIDVELSDSPDDEVPSWRYVLGFKSEGKGAQRILVSQEEVWREGKKLFSRPDKDDSKDAVLLTQTRLEQIAANAEFRELAEFFGSITYLHLVPQLLKFADRLGGRPLENDPFGQSFLERIAKTTERVRNTRLKKISEALTLAVPQFRELRFIKDDSGHPHLEALYSHHRPNAGWQSEEHFSDGTLRLLGLLWALLDGSSMLLLEEPEISLNDAVVKEIPLIIQRLQKNRKPKRQVLISTHSEALLSNPGIDGRGVILLEATADGSVGRTLQEDEASALEAGLSVAEVVLPKTRPSSVNQLGFWQ